LIHLHAIEPDGEAMVLLRQLEAEHAHFRVSWQGSGVVGIPAVYFACSRYLAAPQILDHYRLPITVSDIDLGFHRPVAEAMDPAAALDVAWFETDEPPPSHRLAAGFVHVNTTPGSRRFLALLRALLGRRLRAGCQWMLDQTAIYCVSRALATEPGALSRADLRSLTGATLHDFVEQCSMQFAEKRVLRIAES